MLAERFLALADNLTSAERDNLKLLFGMAAGQLTPEANTDPSALEFEAYRTVANCLAKLQPHRDRVPADGIAWRGHIPQIDASLLEALQKEAAVMRTSAIPHDDHFLGCGGPVANELALSLDLKSFVESNVGPVELTGTASYIYYDTEGQFICPHIDTDVFSINALVMLRHDSARKTKNSYLELYPANGAKITVDLQPGEVIIFWADSIVHGRTPVLAGEVVNILTVGYRPIVS